VPANAEIAMPDLKYFGYGEVVAAHDALSPTAEHLAQIIRGLKTPPYSLASLYLSHPFVFVKHDDSGAWQWPLSDIVLVSHLQEFVVITRIGAHGLGQMHFFSGLSLVCAAFACSPV
jgi:hypothetical protein